MVQKKNIVLFFVILSTTSCSFFKKSNIYFEYNEFIGENFIFVDLDDNYRQTQNFNKVWLKINKKKYRPYHKFLYKKYSIAGIQKERYQDFLVIEDSKENRYKIACKFDKNNKIIFPSYLLFEDIEYQARKMTGEKIWLNITLNSRHFYSLSNYEFKRFEEVIILDAIPFQNNDIGSPVWLKISNHEGYEGLVRYDKNKSLVGEQQYYYVDNPLPEKWGKRKIRRILNKNIDLGMTDIQVRIAIGNPNEINTTSSRHGISEQWIYYNRKGMQTYYQFEYGRLVFIGN